MLKIKLFKHTFVLLFLIALTFTLSEKFYLSWTFWWFDMVLHFFSGGCVAMAAILFWRYYYKNSPISKSEMVRIGIYGALVIGLLWEFYELYLGMVFLSDGLAYVIDTTKDIIVDTSGAFLGSLYAIKLIKNNE